MITGRVGRVRRVGRVGAWGLTPIRQRAAPRPSARRRDPSLAGATDCSRPRSPARSFRACPARRRSRPLRRSMDRSQELVIHIMDLPRPAPRVAGSSRFDRRRARQTLVGDVSVCRSGTPALRTNAPTAIVLTQCTRSRELRPAELAEDVSSRSTMSMRPDRRQNLSGMSARDRLVRRSIRPHRVRPMSKRCVIRRAGLVDRQPCFLDVRVASCSHRRSDASACQRLTRHAKMLSIRLGTKGTSAPRLDRQSACCRGDWSGGVPDYSEAAAPRCHRRRRSRCTQCGFAVNVGGTGVVDIALGPARRAIVHRRNGAHEPPMWTPLRCAEAPARSSRGQPGATTR